MLWMEKSLYLRIEELPGGTRPLPLLSGFSLTTAFRALGCWGALTRRKRLTPI